MSTFIILFIIFFMVVAIFAAVYLTKKEEADELHLPSETDTVVNDSLQKYAEEIKNLPYTEDRVGESFIRFESSTPVATTEPPIQNEVVEPKPKKKPTSKRRWYGNRKPKSTAKSSTPKPKSKTTKKGK